MDGIGVHWYADWWNGPGKLDKTHELFPDKFILYTESCNGKDNGGQTWGLNRDK